MKVGDCLVNKQGKYLTLTRWLPGAGFNVKGKFLCLTDKYITCQLSEAELLSRGYVVK